MLKNNDAEFVRAVILATPSYNEIDPLRDPSSCPPKKVRAQGAGRKRKAPEVRIDLFNWFISKSKSVVWRMAYSKSSPRK